ncbi:MAG: protein kinase, partial [Nanoarchaeota archaeon]|nr:protein kinase [Nanoarchaeota archaeon]
MSLEEKVNKEKYDDRFTPVNISKRKQYNITPIKANNFLNGIKQKEYNKTIVTFLISLRKVKKYPKRFNLGEIHSFIENQIKPSEIKKYNKEFDYQSIIKFKEKKITPKQANDFLKRDKNRFTTHNITEFILRRYSFKQEIESAETIKYKKRFSDRDIISFKKSNIPPEKANSFRKRFSRNEIISLVKYNIDSKIAKKYLRRFDGIAIYELIKANIKPSQAKKYNEQLTSKDIIPLARLKILPDIANLYDNKFNGLGIACLINARVDSQTANKYAKRIIGIELALAKKLGIKFTKIDKLIQDFEKSINEERKNELYFQHAKTDLRSLIYEAMNSCFHSKKPIFSIKGKYANKYINPHFFKILQKKIPNEIFDLLLNEMYGWPTEIFKKMNINYDEASFLFKKEIFPRMLDLTISDIGENPEKYRIIGFGSKSVIILNKQKRICYKLSDRLRRENYLFCKVMTKNKVVHNIIKKKSFRQTYQSHNICRMLELEYIYGNTLDEKLQQETDLSIKETVQYAFDICNGILELRNAGIYHRDLHDRNIMIDEENDKAIIIDLGTATTNPNISNPQNRLYGGN